MKKGERRCILHVFDEKFIQREEKRLNETASAAPPYILDEKKTKRILSHHSNRS